jgi:xanthine dehydrogenase accessory factor
VQHVLCVLRGAGDIATGIAWRLSRAGISIVATELPNPLTVRRRVALSSAVHDGQVDVEGLLGRLAQSADEAAEVARSGSVAVLVSPGMPSVDADVVVDARLAKRNIDTRIQDAPLVVGVGPGFAAGIDCHAVVETQRGHHLGRVFWHGAAAPNTGEPGVIGGHGASRVLRAPAGGQVNWRIEIGASVQANELLGSVGGVGLRAPFDGVVRGLIRPGTTVEARLKIGDVDPRGDPAVCHEISDKALAVGGGVLEAVVARQSGIAPDAGSPS